MLNIIDSHCHLHFPAYGADLPEVLRRMRERGCGAITVGTTLSTSAGAVAFADAHENVWATVGYHPEHFTSSFHDEAEGDAGVYSLVELKRIASSSPKVVAIGETGLDFFRIDAERDQAEGRRMQEQGFRDHIALAHELDIPLVIHCRDALSRLADIVVEEQRAGKNVRGVVHCYTGTWAEAEPLLACGLHLSFTGIVTFPLRKTDDVERHVHRVIERMPLDRMLVETDAPWLTPAPYRGQRNEPVYTEFIAQKIAELRGMTTGEVCRRTMENTTRLFRLPLV